MPGQTGLCSHHSDLQLIVFAQRNNLLSSVQLQKLPPNILVIMSILLKVKIKNYLSKMVIYKHRIRSNQIVI